MGSLQFGVVNYLTPDCRLGKSIFDIKLIALFFYHRYRIMVMPLNYQNIENDCCISDSDTLFDIQDGALKWA